MSIRTCPTRRAFTLVEMLVVVAIIVILAALLIPAVYYAQLQARVTRVGMEVEGLHQAVEAYKHRYGDYPPDFSNNDVVNRHMRKVFPRNTAPAPTGLTQPQAIVFWLSGFTSDPENPLGYDGTTMKYRKLMVVPNPPLAEPLFGFDPLRLHDAANPDKLTTLDFKPHYFPLDKLRAPYVYFDSRTYGAIYTPPSGVALGTAVAYKTKPSAAATATWVNATTFQIVSAGMDNDYGTGTGDRLYPPTPGGGMSAGDRDNIANFSQGKTLEAGR
jgi:prepilin-type N-terminal cleavage/methylation domain-containing protein